jgi:hypothetical protein
MAPRLSTSRRRRGDPARAADPVASRAGYALPASERLAGHAADQSVPLGLPDDDAGGGARRGGPQRTLRASIAQRAPSEPSKPVHVGQSDGPSLRITALIARFRSSQCQHDFDPGEGCLTLVRHCFGRLHYSAPIAILIFSVRILFQTSDRIDRGDRPCATRNVVPHLPVHRAANRDVPGRGESISTDECGFLRRTVGDFRGHCSKRPNICARKVFSPPTYGEADGYDSGADRCGRSPAAHRDRRVPSDGESEVRHGSMVLA